MTKFRFTQFALSVAAISGFVACASTEGNEQSLSQSGLQLTLEVGAETGVDGIRYEIVAVDCEEGTPLADVAPIVIEKDLEDVRIPGGIDTLEDNPLDKESSHAFADYFVTVEPGCYDVTTTPLTTDLICHAATEKSVVVNEGETTEVFLINQCDGSDPGAIDTVAAVNHPPVLLDVSYPGSKFVESCELQTICATAQDPESDPLEFEWIVTSGPAVVGPSVVSQEKNADGSVTQCVSYIAQAAGKVELTVNVYDLLHTGTEFQRIEDWLSDAGYPNDSHTSLDFMFYAAEGALPVDEVCGDDIDNDCDGEIDDADVCSGIPAEGCFPGTSPVCAGDLDVMILQDMSGSFGDDKRVMDDLAPTLASTLFSASAGLELGVASFVDKPFSPFGSVGDYVYQLDLPLTTDTSAFVTAVQGLIVRSGNDYSESQIEALQLLAYDAAAGFRTDSQRFVVVATDAPFHVAGDCGLGTCTAGANDGNGVLNPLEDYPSQAQVLAALEASDITPVFLVAGGSAVTPSYEALVSTLGRGSVVELSSDSSNLINAILTGLGSACRCE